MNKVHIAVLALAMLLAVPAFAGRAGAGRMLLQANGTDGNATLPANQTSAKISSEILNATAIPIQQSTVFAPNDATWLQIFQDGGYNDYTAFLAANNQSQGLITALQGLVVPGLYRSDMAPLATNPSTSLATLNGGNLTVAQNAGQFTVTYPGGSDPYPIVKADYNQTETDTLIHVVNASPSFLSMNGTSGGNGTTNGTRRFYF